MLLALCVCVCVCALVDSSQECAAVNTQRGTEVTLPSTHNATRASFPFHVCWCAPACAACHCAHLKRAGEEQQQKEKERVQSALQSGRPRGRGAPPESRPAWTGSLWRFPRGGSRGPFYPDTNQTQQHKRIQGWGGWGALAERGKNVKRGRH